MSRNEKAQSTTKDANEPKVNLADRAELAAEIAGEMTLITPTEAIRVIAYRNSAVKVKPGC